MFSFSCSTSRTFLIELCKSCKSVMLDILMARSEAQQQQKAAEESTRSKEDSSDIDDDSTDSDTGSVSGWSEPAPD